MFLWARALQSQAQAWGFEPSLALQTTSVWVDALRP